MHHMLVRRSVWFVPFLLTALAIPLSLDGSQQSEADTLALVGGRIYTSSTADAIGDGVVIVKKGKIEKVGPPA